MQISPAALAALSLHNAARAVADRCDGSWWILDAAKWEVIASLRTGPEHSFVLAVINFHSERQIAA